MTQRNFDFSVIFSSEYLVGSKKVLTHTHTHRPDLLISFFIRAREACHKFIIHGDSGRILRAVFRTLSATDIRENKERFYPQNPHDFRAANTPISVNKNSCSADRPHVGTDPVSVRLTSVLRTEAIYWSKGPSDCVFIPSLPDGCGQQITPRGLSLHAGWCPNWHWLGSKHIGRFRLGYGYSAIRMPSHPQSHSTPHPSPLATMTNNVITK